MFFNTSKRKRKIIYICTMLFIGFIVLLVVIANEQERIACQKSGGVFKHSTTKEGVYQRECFIKLKE